MNRLPRHGGNLLEEIRKFSFSAIGCRFSSMESKMESTGYKLANDGQDTRAIQQYLGHRNIQHTTRYTDLAPNRFKDFGGTDSEPVGPNGGSKNPLPD